MKRIIDINEKIKEYIEQYIPIGGGDHIFCYPDQIVEMIANGTPIPDNATNGDVIKAIFDVKEIDMCNTYGVHFPGEEDYSHYFFKEWWNAPYQKGGNI